MSSLFLPFIFAPINNVSSSIILIFSSFLFFSFLFVLSLLFIVTFLLALGTMNTKNFCLYLVGCWIHFLVIFILLLWFFIYILYYLMFQMCITFPWSFLVTFLVLKSFLLNILQECCFSSFFTLQVKFIVYTLLGNLFINFYSNIIIAMPYPSVRFTVIYNMIFWYLCWFLFPLGLYRLFKNIMQVNQFIYIYAIIKNYYPGEQSGNYHQKG